MLTNEKYIGNLVYNRASSKLGASRTLNDPSEWLRVERAFKPIVPAWLFYAAQARTRRQANPRYTEEEMLTLMRQTWARDGVLSGRRMGKKFGTPSASCYWHRFGTMANAYRRIGYEPRVDTSYVLHLTRHTKRATSLAAFSSADAGKYDRKFSVRTYMAEVRRFGAILDRSERHISELQALGYALRPSFSDRRFISKLESQGLAMLPASLATSIRSEHNQDAPDVPIPLRPKLSGHAMKIFGNRELLLSVFGILEKMTPARQIECVRYMVRQKCFRPSIALRVISLPDNVPVSALGQPKRIAVVGPDRRQLMITEAEVLNKRARRASVDYAQHCLELVMARGYVRAVMENAKLASYLVSHHAACVRRIRATLTTIDEDLRAYAF